MKGGGAVWQCRLAARRALGGRSPIGKAKNAGRYCRLRLGADCMTPEAAAFVSEYRGVLDWCRREVDSFLAREGGGAPLADVLRRAKPLIDGMAEDQAGRAGPPDLYMPCHSMIYLLCRAAAPGAVVETGVQKGGSTYMILRAMQANGRGMLHSIDIGRFFTFNNGPPLSLIGPLVRLAPDSAALESHWKLVKADAQKSLGRVLGAAGRLDMFMALQGHTYEVQRHEGNLAWPEIRSGGVFVIDRPDWNDGRYLREFLAERGGEVAYHETYKEGSSADPFEFAVIVKK